MKYLIIILSLFASACSYDTNAYAFKDKILITSEMMKFVKNHTELSYLIGHESGHIVLGHNERLSWTDKEAKKRELEADKFSIHMLKDAGHDACLVNKFWDRMINENPRLFFPMKHRRKWIKENCNGNF